MNEELGLRGRYRVEWSGSILPEQLFFDDDPNARADLSERDRQGVLATIARRRASGQVILQAEDGSLPPLYRLRTATGTPDRLTLSLGRTDYGEYLFTNIERPERRKLRGDKSMSDALAVCAVLVTKDNQALYGVRSKSIADIPAGSDQTLFHVLPSGHPEPPYGPFEGLVRELEEEAAVLASEITAAHLTGLIRALPSGKPELTFLLKSNVSLTEISARRPRDAWEFDSLASFPWTLQDAQAWLQRHVGDAVAPGHAAVALGARAEFGQV